MNIFSVPRINALGLKGPETASEKILEGIKNTHILNVYNENISEDEETIYEAARNASKENTPSFFIGGDHSITYPIGKAFLEEHTKEDSFLIVFDAHADAMQHMKEPTHEEFIHGLVKAGWNPKQIAIVGLRKVEQVEQEFLDKEGIWHCTDKEFDEEKMREVLEAAQRKKVYVSIDIDVLNPKVAPGVSYKEENGFTEETLTKAITKIKNRLDIKFWDLVEYVPQNDEHNKTLKILKRIRDLILE